MLQTQQELKKKIKSVQFVQGDEESDEDSYIESGDEEAMEKQAIDLIEKEISGDEKEEEGDLATNFGEMKKMKEEEKPKGIFGMKFMIKGQE